MPPAQAIREACLARFRPIMMTTLAAMLGALPLIIATGPGSELRRPLGMTIVGGLLVSQILTLYTTPVIYLLLDRLHRRLGGRGPGAGAGRDAARPQAGDELIRNIEFENSGASYALSLPRLGGGWLAREAIAERKSGGDCRASRQRTPHPAARYRSRPPSPKSG